MLAALALVLLAGAMNGSFATPMKRVRGWEWEHTWLTWSFFAMIVIPVIVAVFTVPNLQAVYRAAGPQPLVRTAVYGMLWGAGAVLFGLGVTRVGLALGFGIILGTATSFGALIPFLELHRERLFSTAGALTVGGVGIVSAGVAACARAGLLRESAVSPQLGAASFRTGLGVCVLSGLGSTVMSVALNEAAPIYSAAEAFGTPSARSMNAVWPVLLAGGFAVNAAYCAFLVVRRRNVARFSKGVAVNLALVVAMSVLWSGSNFAYGVGARSMGSLGLVLGWPIFMGAIVLTANAWGLLTGEWHRAGSRAIGWAATGNLLIIVGIPVIASAGRWS